MLIDRHRCNAVNARLHIAVYAPSSPQRLVDMARLAFAFDFVKSFIVIKPTGMAAQVGLADVSKMAYKLGKNLVILQSLNELIEVLKTDRVFVLVHDPEARSIEEVQIEGDVVIVIQGGEAPIPKQEAAIGEPIRIPLDYGITIPVADEAILLHVLATHRCK